MTLSKSARNFLNSCGDKKVVFTNGCFDIIHAGHVAYLKEAKDLGDFLFIGLNSDSSVSKLKGEERPINNQEDRKAVLEALKPVDFVEIFSEDTPYKLIEEVAPAVLVKGGDWKIENIVGHDIVQGKGGSVYSLSFKPGRSTTSLIEKIRG